MAHLAELRRNWGPLLAATIGMGSGMSIVGVITTTIAPSMVADNHWKKAEFALARSLSPITAFVFPSVGRLADLIGVRATALIGQVTLPLAYLGYASKFLLGAGGTSAPRNQSRVTRSSPVHVWNIVQSKLQMIFAAMGILLCVQNMTVRFPLL